MKFARGRPQDLPGGGHEICPADGHHRPGCSAQRAHPLTGEGLGEPHGVAAGLVHVGHQFVEPNWGAGSRRRRPQSCVAPQPRGLLLPLRGQRE